MPVEESRTVDAPADPNVSIWRYIDFSKLVAVLTSRTLFFCRADKLGDSFEGSWPKRNVAARAPYFERLHLPGANPEQIARAFSDFSRIYRQFVLVNCWHASTYESLAMWHIYAGLGAGIAIRSTYARLVRALASCPRRVVIGMVRYIDFDREVAPDWSPVSPFVHKRLSFSYEAELRAIVELELPGPDRAEWSNAVPPVEVGINIPVDIGTLVEAIYVSPQSPAWFVETVRNLVGLLTPGLDVRHSNIVADPVF